jgi:hypothetical protein
MITIIFVILFVCALIFLYEWLFILFHILHVPLLSPLLCPLWVFVRCLRDALLECVGGAAFCERCLCIVDQYSCFLHKYGHCIELRFYLSVDFNGYLLIKSPTTPLTYFSKFLFLPSYNIFLQVSDIIIPRHCLPPSVLNQSLPWIICGK